MRNRRWLLALGVLAAGCGEEDDPFVCPATRTASDSEILGERWSVESFLELHGDATTRAYSEILNETLALRRTITRTSEPVRLENCDIFIPVVVRIEVPEASFALAFETLAVSQEPSGELGVVKLMADVSFDESWPQGLACPECESVQYKETIRNAVANGSIDGSAGPGASFTRLLFWQIRN